MYGFADDDPDAEHDLAAASFAALLRAAAIATIRRLLCLPGERRKGGLPPPPAPRPLDASAPAAPLPPGPTIDAGGDRRRREN